MMKQLRWIAPLLILLGLLLKFVQDIDAYLFLNPDLAVLSSPGGLNIHPIAFTIPDDTPYFSQHRVTSPAPVQTIEWGMAVSPGLSMSFIYLLTGLYLYLFARMKRLEKAYLFFAIFISSYTMLYFDFLTYNRFPYLFYFVLVLINGAFLYLYRAIYSQGTPGAVLIVITLAAILLPWLMFPQSAAQELQLFRLISSSYYILALYCVWYSVQKFRQKKQQRPAPSTHILAMTALGTVVLPVGFLFGPLYFSVAMNHSYNVAYFVPAIFPMLFFIMGMRLGITSFVVPVNGMFVRLSYLMFFSLIYWFAIGYHIFKLPYKPESMLAYLTFSLLFVFLFDPLRTVFFTYFHRFFITRRIALNRYLHQTAQYVNNPRRIDDFLEKLLNTLQEGLGVPKVKLIFSSEIFREWTIDSDRVSFLPDDHPLWLQLKFWQRARGHYPAYTQTAIGPIRDLLIKENGFLLIAFDKFNAVALVSQRTSREPILSEDVKFLRQVLRLSEPLMENYRYQIDNIQLRRRERELELSARIQKKIIPVHRSMPGLEFASLFQASEKVTGDYIDFIPISRNSYIVALGDVSGHGLGSAYLMALVRAFLRGAALVANLRLDEIFGNLNDYLAGQYRGSDFMTLFAVKIGLTAGRAELEFISAGHHPALMFETDSDTVQKLENNQRVLGVIRTPYTSRKITIEKPFRLFLYSDGAFEVFGREGKMLGHEKLIKWLRQSRTLQLKEQLQFIYDKIENYAPNRTDADRDDTSLVAVEVNPTAIS